jgi:toxin CptA
MPQPARLRIELKPSRQLAVLLGVAHTLTAAAMLLLPIGLGIRIALLMLIALSLARSARHPAVSASPHAFAALEVHRDGSVQARRRSGDAFSGRVLGESFVSPLLTVVAMRSDDDERRERIVLLPDSADADALRALRVWLRFKVEVG